ncbi:MAG: type II secretion system protein GspM [Plesiomonas sp.]|uniref:type II secretion system protein GspM n=1 Tax=Plesiomonas sp. TaxID=2486279 RepID=UPI003F3112FC
MPIWWKQLSLREKRLLQVGGGCLLLGMFFWGIWQPLNQHIAQQALRLRQNQQLLTQIHASTESIRRWQQQQSKTTTADNSNQSLSQQVSFSASQNGLKVIRMQPQDRSLQLWIEDLPFNQLLSWLLKLRIEYGVDVVYLDLLPTEQPGMVKVERLQLEQP